GHDLRRRGGIADALGQGGDDRQGGVAGGGGGGGQGTVHGGALLEGAVGLAALRAGEPEQRRLDPSQGGDRGGGRRADQGVHRHRTLPVRRAPAPPPHQGGGVQGVRGAVGRAPAAPPQQGGALQGGRGAERGAQRLRRPAHRLLRRDPLHPGARRGG